MWSNRPDASVEVVDWTMMNWSWASAAGPSVAKMPRAAVAAEPELLLLDEPTASLDPQATAAIEARIGQAAAAGVKIVLVTHDRGQAQRLADEVLFLHRGALAEHSGADAFFNKPSSAAAQAYLEGRLLL